MAIPDFQSIMLPLLKFCSDGKEHLNREALDALAQEFGLTEKEQKALPPSGQQCIIDNRVAWARAHMKMAQLLENTRRGVFRITERGKEILKQNPFEINLHLLRQFPEYDSARARHRENRQVQTSLLTEEQETKTPAERLGLDIIYIQAKKWENTISRPEIQKFAGALQGKRARKGIFITTSDFSTSAHEYVAAIESKIILIHGQQLAQFMMDFGVGVATDAIYELKRLDSDYFTDI